MKESCDKFTEFILKFLILQKYNFNLMILNSFFLFHFAKDIKYLHSNYPFKILGNLIQTRKFL
jgi:hypothetical protein